MAKYVGALDQGTTSTRFMIFDHAGAGGRHRSEGARADLPEAGLGRARPDGDLGAHAGGHRRARWRKADRRPSDLAAVGITNQRETTVVWDKPTGKPVYNAIVWQDTRTDKICNELAKDGGQDRFRAEGRPAAGDLLLRPEDQVDPRQRRRRARPRPRRATSLFGNIDTWVHLEPHRRPRRRRARHRRDQRQPHHADEPHDPGLGSEILLRSWASRAPCCPRSRPPPRCTARPAAPWRASRWPATSATSRQPSSARPASAPARPRTPTAPAASCCSTPAPRPFQSKNGLLTTLGYKIGDQPAVYCPRGLDRHHRRPRAVAARQPGHDRESSPTSRRWPRPSMTTAASTSSRPSPACSRRTGRAMPAA